MEGNSSPNPSHDCPVDQCFISSVASEFFLLCARMIDAFEEQIGAAVESAITKKLREGILKLDSFLQALPKEIPVDDNASLNVTFVKDPSLSNSSIGFDINGLFTAKERITIPMIDYKNSQPSVVCTGPSKMLGISLAEAVFNSASALYYDVSFRIQYVYP